MAVEHKNTDREQYLEQYNKYEEISLKELLQTIFARKKMIILISSIFILFGFIISFFMIKPTYSSTTTISVTPTLGASNKVSDVEDLLETYSQLPAMTVESYKEQVKSHEVLIRVIRDLQLKNEDGTYISTSSLANKINVSIVKGTNLINITSSSSNPELASNIANAISESFIEFISEKTRERGSKSAELIEAQLAIEESNLNEKSKILTDYISNNQSIDELKAQKNSLISQITAYKSELNSVEKNIMTEKASLQVLLGEDYDEVYDNLELNMDVDGNVYENIKLDLADVVGLQDSLMTVKITNLETQLIQNSANKKSLQIKIKDMEEKLKIAQTDLAEQEHKYNSILRDFNLAKTAYDAYQNRHKQALITAASDIGRTSVLVSSYAIPSIVPVSPNKKMILAISAVLGLMISVFFAIFSDYWKKA